MLETQQEFYIGAAQLLRDGVIGGVHTVNGLHVSVLDNLAKVGLKGTINRVITEQVYRFILGSSHFAGWLLEHTLRRLPLPGGEAPLTRRQLLAVSSINGAFGDWLEQQDRLWAQPMHLRRNGAAVTPDAEGLRASVKHPHPHVIVLIHGLCLNEHHWMPPDHEGFGARWEHHTDVTVYYVRYNTGLHIHENGKQLALLLEQLQKNYPIPIQRLSIVGHSMGGLISRSACSYAQDMELGWLSVLQDLACLGSPHLGAPLERIGQWVTHTLDKNSLTTSLGRAGRQRSAGIKDLRHACLRHEDWQDTHPDAPHPVNVTALPLLPSVRYCLLAANWKSPAGETLGDGLVQVSSAMARELGGHPLGTPSVCRPLLHGIHHMALPRNDAVFNVLNEWLFNDLQEGTGLLAGSLFP